MGVLFLCVPRWGLARDSVNLRIKLTPLVGMCVGVSVNVGLLNLLTICYGCVRVVVFVAPALKAGHGIFSTKMR